MTGIQRLEEMIEDQEDTALKQTVNYLISRKDMESKYLNEQKTLKKMCEFIKSKANNHIKNGWNYITNEVVYAWAVMYFLLPDEFLKIKTKENNNKISKNSSSSPNNIVSLENAKQKIKQKKEAEQLNLFGGAEND